MKQRMSASVHNQYCQVGFCVTLRGELRGERVPFPRLVDDPWGVRKSPSAGVYVVLFTPTGSLATANCGEVDSVCRHSNTSQKTSVINAIS